MSYTLNLRGEVKRKGVWEEGVKEGRETETKEEYEVRGKEQRVEKNKVSQQSEHLRGKERKGLREFGTVIISSE